VKPGHELGVAPNPAFTFDDWCFAGREHRLGIIPQLLGDWICRRAA
jgi:hypothetical protein